MKEVFKLTVKPRLVHDLEALQIGSMTWSDLIIEIIKLITGLTENVST